MATASDPDLGRAGFAAAVTLRDRGRCVLCGGTGTEAHHVLDRRLFPDGGYRLSNGALVCNPCHWDCETTKVSVERVREAAGILSPHLPPWATPVVPLDKWGNAVLPSGLRERGPLASDDGCRRALARGGYSGLLVEPGTA